VLRAGGIAAAVAATALGGCTGAAGDVAAGAGAIGYTVQAQPAPGSCRYHAASSGQELPDPACTPGASNPQVTQANIGETICRPGYTRQIRPPRAITDAEKRSNALSYGYSAACLTPNMTT
jgi:hypothetical protein